MLDLNRDPEKKTKIPKRFKEYSETQKKEREANKKRNGK
jgi:hypothetical protein